jgi:hypothetical protein
MSGTKDIFDAPLTAGEFIIRVNEIPGDASGLGPLVATVLVTASGLDSGDILQMFPSNKFDVAGGPGDASVLTTFTNNGDDKSFPTTGPANPVNLVEGFWNQEFRFTLATTTGVNTLDQIQVSWVSLGIGDFTPNPGIPKPTNLEIINAEFIEDEDKQEVTLSWDSNDPTAEGHVIVQTDPNAVETIVGSVPEDITEFTVIIENPIEGVYGWTVQTYTYGPDEISDPSDPEVLEIPNFLITMAGGISFGGSATLIFLVDPSGIYGLIPDKTDDTLYNRIEDPPTSIDVKIPNPFVKTAYFGD